MASVHDSGLRAVAMQKCEKRSCQHFSGNIRQPEIFRFLLISMSAYITFLGLFVAGMPPSLQSTLARDPFIQQTIAVRCVYDTRSEAIENQELSTGRHLVEYIGAARTTAPTNLKHCDHGSFLYAANNCLGSFVDYSTGM